MTTLTGDAAERTVASWARPVLVLLATGPVVMLLGLAVGHGAGPGNEPAVWWPAAAPAAVAVALVSRGGSVRSSTPRALLVLGVLVGVGLGSLAARLMSGRGPAVEAGWVLADVAQATVTGLVLASGTGLCLRVAGDLVRLVAGGAAGAVVAGGLGVAAAGLPFGHDAARLLLETSVSRSSAVILLVPLAMRLPRRAPVRPVETVALWGVVIATALLVLGPAGALPLTFLPVAVLVVATLRQAPWSTVGQLPVVGVIVVLTTEYGAGPFARTGGELSGALEPGYLTVVAVTVLAVLLTVSARDGALRELAELRRFDRAALENVAAGVVVCDGDGRLVLRNAAYRRASGTAAHDATAQAGPSGGDGLRSCERRLVARALDGGELRGVHARSSRSEPPGDFIADALPIRSPDGRLLGAVATFTDVTHERAAQTRLREAVAFHDAVLAASPDVIFITDVASHRVVWASGTIEPTLGFTPSQVVELDRASRLNLVHPDDVEALHAADDAAAGLRDGEVWTVRVRMSTDRGEPRWMSRRVTPFSRDTDGRVVQLLGVSRDVTDMVAVEQRLTDAANRDPLTGALNRRALLDRLGELVNRVTESRSVTTPVLFCDLDGFKAVNDSWGHGAGDRLLTTVAQRISATLRDGDVLARAGGDEFVLLLGPARGAPPDRTPAGLFAESRSAVLHRARTVGHRILEVVAHPVEVQGSRLRVTVSIGIALVRPGIGPDEVLRDADAAMYRAKSTGKNRLHVFEVAPERARTDPGPGSA